MYRLKQFNSGIDVFIILLSTTRIFQLVLLVIMNTKSRSNKSICENSMKLMRNIVKVSYISLAKISLRKGAPPPLPPQRIAAQNRVPSLPRYTRNLRSQEPINSSKPVSYLIDPDETNRSSMSMIKDDESVDLKAWDFIRKVHEKNLKDVSEITNFSEFILPPPPRIMLQSSSAY
ncbi:hypothetical protein L1887_26251 [Cichorium endivia]|nr:hypothetical protein L1887_26251 [Cichorium endivia]